MKLTWFVLLCLSLAWFEAESLHEGFESRATSNHFKVDSQREDTQEIQQQPHFRTEPKDEDPARWRFKIGCRIPPVIEKYLNMLKRSRIIKGFTRVSKYKPTSWRWARLVRNGGVVIGRRRCKRSIRRGKRSFTLCPSCSNTKELPLSNGLTVKVEEVSKCSQDQCYFSGIAQGKCVPTFRHIILPVFDANCVLTGFSTKTIKVNCECRAFFHPMKPFGMDID